MQIMGPAPARFSRDRAALSAPRATVLEHLQKDASVATVAQVAVSLGMHTNTARKHLDALAYAGLVSRRPTAPVGRGRPGWCYSADDCPTEPDARVREYAGLAEALASHIARTSTQPAVDGAAAGETWGRALADGAPSELGADNAGGENAGGNNAALEDAAARASVVALLAELGFAPQANADNTSVALLRCPLLDVATRYPEVVCAVHLGLVRGALDHLGADTSGVTLLPFAEPNACRLHLAHAPAHAMADVALGA